EFDERRRRRVRGDACAVHLLELVEVHQMVFFDVLGWHESERRDFLCRNRMPASERGEELFRQHFLLVSRGVLKYLVAGEAGQQDALGVLAISVIVRRGNSMRFHEVEQPALTDELIGGAGAASSAK